MTTIQLKNIKKAYGETVIMEDMQFTINEGERLVLLGPSGCGKSTILRMIAGFEEVTAGKLKFNDAIMNEVAPGDRDVAMVFQNYALYPHMTVEENITYGLRINKVPKEQIKERLDEVVEALNLGKYKNRKPSELSGGQRQRVALARATVKDSDIFLLDEPLSNLDAQLRVSARESLMAIHKKYGQTMIYVTHDQIEAMTFGDRIALLNFGKLQQIDTPENIYRKPADIFTARFIGNPPMNVLDNSSYRDGKVFVGEEQSIQVHENWSRYLKAHLSKDLRVGIRPESVQVFNKPTPNTFMAKISHVENQGSNYANYIHLANETVTVLTRFKTNQPGDKVYLKFINDQMHFFDAANTKNVGYPENVEAKIDAGAGKGESLEELILRDNTQQQLEF